MAGFTFWRPFGLSDLGILGAVALFALAMADYRRDGYVLFVGFANYVPQCAARRSLAFALGMAAKILATFGGAIS